MENVNGIYAISDFIIRGEECFGVGRTVYEGLYSGCNVIIQGERQIDLFKISGYDKFKKKIFFYEPRNPEILRKTVISVVNNCLLYTSIFV